MYCWELYSNVNPEVIFFLEFRENLSKILLKHASGYCIFRAMTATAPYAFAEKV
jgi:hypothetical protein